MTIELDKNEKAKAWKMNKSEMLAVVGNSLMKPGIETRRLAKNPENPNRKVRKDLVCLKDQKAGTSIEFQIITGRKIIKATLVKAEGNNHLWFYWLDSGEATSYLISSSRFMMVKEISEGYLVKYGILENMKSGWLFGMPYKNRSGETVIGLFGIGDIRV